MIKALIVGFVFLGSFTAHAQGPALQKVIALASTQGKTSTEAVTRSLLTQVEGSSSALAQVVKNDPLYIFNKGNLNEESLRYLGSEAQSALLQIGKKTTFKAVSALPEFEIALSSVSSLEHAADNIPLSTTGKVKASINPDTVIESDIRSLGLSEPVATDLANELKAFKNETGLFYTNRGMCKGLDDEAATNFTAFVRDARENLKRTRAKCPGQLYGSIAEVWIHFQKRMGREGDALWRAVEKNQTCYTGVKLRPGVLSAVNQISQKNGGQVPAENEPSGCPL
jgi:hypothetical protein